MFLNLRAVTNIITAFALCSVSLNSYAQQYSYGIEEYISAELVTSHDTITPNETFKIGVLYKMAPDWHIYWKNAGDAGIPTDIQFSSNNSVIETNTLQSPAPIRFDLDDIINYGYKGTTLYQTTATISETQEPVAHVQAHTTFLLCKEVCIPGEITLTKQINVSEKSKISENNTLFNTYAPIEATVEDAHATIVDNETITLSITDKTIPLVTKALFIPSEEGVFVDSHPQSMAVNNNTLSLTLKRDLFYDDTPIPDEITGVVVLNDDIMVNINTATSTPKTTDTVTEAPNSSMFIIIILASAFLAGVILNLMPCVLPVLSLKVLGLIHHAQQGKPYKHGLVYTLGVIFTFNVLATIITSLQSLGGELGWGFQLQNPVFVAILAGIMLLMGLQLLGTFSIGESFTKLGGLQTKVTYKSTFMSGALMVILATPCTAPFMGSAIAFALAQQNPLSTYAVFSALGFGLATPYLLLTMAPDLLKKLPKPGAWESKFKLVLAIPMLLTMAWLVWVFSNQTTAMAITSLIIGFALLSLACLWMGKQKTTLSKYSVLTIIVAGVIALNVSSLSSTKGSMHSNTSTVWNEWSTPAVANALANGENVFINFTADWCITCKVNEKLVLNRSGFAQHMQNTNTTAFKADWTKRNSTISQALESYGRRGVPLYIYINAGEPNKVVTLNQILTLGHVKEMVK